MRFRETLVLYTDGLTEARRNGDFFGESRLLERVQSLSALSPSELTQSLYSEALDFAGGRLSDDLEPRRTPAGRRGVRREGLRGCQRSHRH